MTGLRAAARIMRDLTEGAIASEPLAVLANRICRTQAHHAKARATIFLAQGDRMAPYASERFNGRPDPHLWNLFILATEPLPLAIAARDTGCPQIVADAASPLVAGWWADTFGLTSACAIPLGPPGAVIGVLVFDRPEPDAFDEAFRTAAVAAASEVTAILEWGLLTEDVLSNQRINAATRRLLAESAEATSVFEAASTVAQLVHDVLHTERTIVFYQRDPELPELEVATVGMPSDADRIVRDVVAGLALRAAPRLRQLSSTDGAVFFETVRPGMVRAGGIAERLGVRSYLSLPLSTGTGRVGHILAGDVSRARPWRAWERKFVGELAAEATLIMESARLREIDQVNRERLVHQATHDALTDLANRRAFGVRLTEVLDAAAGTGQHVSLLLLDVDRFKSVNDTLGHHVGDRLLVEVAHSLLGAVRGRDLAARLGGDEFAVLLPGADHRRAEMVAARISEAVDAACRRAKVGAGVAASIGIAVHPDDGADSEALLRAADAAMYQAKRSGAPYGASGAGDLTTWRGVAGELREAIGRGELVLHYQPKVDLRTGAPVGVEAVVRWRHPSKGLLGPHDFLPVVQAAGLMRSLTSWVLEEATGQAAAWRAAGLDLSMAVKVTASDLTGPELPRRIAGALTTRKLPAAALTLELTEQTMVSDRRSALTALDAVRSLGVRISLDDFGTGYSSLAYLETLPIDELKIDRSFLLRGGLERSQDRVLRAIIRLGHELDLTVVTEGVESQATAQWLVRLCCDQAQGYYFAPPLEARDLVAWTESRIAAQDAAAPPPASGCVGDRAALEPGEPALRG